MRACIDESQTSLIITHQTRLQKTDERTRSSIAG
jgi:hypothetical protein